MLGGPRGSLVRPWTLRPGDGMHSMSRCCHPPACIKESARQESGLGPLTWFTKVRSGRKASAGTAPDGNRIPDPVGDPDPDDSPGGCCGTRACAKRVDLRRSRNRFHLRDGAYWLRAQKISARSAECCHLCQPGTACTNLGRGTPPPLGSQALRAQGRNRARAAGQSARGR